MFVETQNMFSFVEIIFIKSNYLFYLVDYKLHNMTFNYKHEDKMLQFRPV